MQTFIRRRQELGHASPRDVRVVVEGMSSVLIPKLAIRLILSWAPGYLHISTDVTDARWAITSEISQFSTNLFTKRNMPPRLFRPCGMRIGKDYVA